MGRTWPRLQSSNFNCSRKNPTNDGRVGNSRWRHIPYQAPYGFPFPSSSLSYRPWYACTCRCAWRDALVQTQGSRQDRYLRWSLPPQSHTCQPVRASITAHTWPTSFPRPSFPFFISSAIPVYALNLRVCISHRLTREALPRTTAVAGIGCR
jgi:hypothetical protein